jgi:hypothetical protein
LSDLNNKDIARNSERDFAIVALRDTPSFLMLLTTMIQIQFYQGGLNADRFWHYRSTAISKLNDCLSDTSDNITDEMIFTVGMLAYVDVSVAFDQSLELCR